MQKNRGKYLLGLLVVLALAGAAYLAMRLINADLVSKAFGFSPGGNGNGNGMSLSRVRVESAEELPARKADVVGPLTSQSENVLTISAMQGNEIRIDPGGNQDQGTPTEVVVDQDTQIYLDVTIDPENPPEGGDITTQQIVEPMTLEEIQPDDYISVWGQKRGDRYVAEVLLILRPVLMRSGGEG